MPTKKPKKAQEINDQIETWENYWRDNKNNYDEYTQFVQGNQWLDDEARVMESYKKIPLTFNKISPLANHMLGEQRQNTPTIECVPEENTPVEISDIRQAIVHDITFDSSSKEVYQTAFQSSIIGGYGAYYIDTEYESDHSFNQVIKINKVPMPTRCFWDVSATEPTKVDGAHCGFRTRMSRAKFRAIYGRKIEMNLVVYLMMMSRLHW